MAVNSFPCSMAAFSASRPCEHPGLMSASPGLGNNPRQSCGKSLFFSLLAGPRGSSSLPPAASSKITLWTPYFYPHRMPNLLDSISTILLKRDEPIDLFFAARIFFSLPEARKMNRSERISGGRAPDFVTHVNGSRRFKRCLSKEFVVENSFAVELIEHKIDSSEEIQISGIMESIGCSTDKCLAVSVLFEKIAPRRSIDDLAQELRPWLWNENSLKIQFASIPLARKI